MTDAEFSEFENKRENYDESFCAIIQKYYQHPYVMHGIKSTSTRRKVYEILFSSMTEDEIWAELERRAPRKGHLYM